MERGRKMNLERITILLPPSRRRTTGLARLGFETAGEITYQGQIFRRFMLVRPAAGKR